jgi:hypothetical protein
MPACQGNGIDSDERRMLRYRIEVISGRPSSKGRDSLLRSLWAQLSKLNKEGVRA